MGPAVVEQLLAALAGAATAALLELVRLLADSRARRRGERRTRSDDRDGDERG